LDTSVLEDSAAPCSAEDGPLKHWYPTTTLCGATAQKTTNSFYIAVKTSNLITKHMLMSNHQNAEQYHNLMITNISLQNVLSIWEQQ
jgi:hypothetical protein